jgi:cyclic pyranopterin phosphate synthase
MTTNGFLFPPKAQALHAAGLRRISFSLDSLTGDNFKKITGRAGLEEVLASIKLAQSLGLHPVKVNAVVIRGLNDHEIEALASFAREHARLQARFDLRPVVADNPSATAKRWSFPDGRGEIGIIAPVSEPFCGHCNRIRLTADGKIRTCLFSVTEHDLRSQLRADASDEALAEWLKGVVWQKEARHHIGEPDFVPPPRSMSCIGG